MATANFNKVHKNGSVSYRVVGSTGAVYIAKTQLRPEFPFDNPPATLDEALGFLVEPGAGATERAAEKSAKQIEREAAKVAKAAQSAEKAQARLIKLQAAADTARARAEAAVAKAAGGQ